MQFCLIEFVLLRPVEKSHTAFAVTCSVHEPHLIHAQSAGKRGGLNAEYILELKSRRLVYWRRSRLPPVIAGVAVGGGACWRTSA